MGEAVIPRWSVNTEHSEIRFRVKDMMISKEGGHLKEFNATIETVRDAFVGDELDLGPKVGSIDIKNNGRDITHLKSNDFFQSLVYPGILFKSNYFDGNTLKGNLTIRGITKEIELDVNLTGMEEEAPDGQLKAGFEMTGVIDKKDFDPAWCDRDRSW